ncbi:unnamed protein product [Brassicogethes aeneus]|uniref:Uncharacterized protein n=1 Tax=Brassicogethes aeneus TaxID=1431903 RepID=A0A9P0AWA2_BRAAE|nr:unnamed protein product [Brassicogethes aeneus]
MTESRIFELILKNNTEITDYSFAKLNRDSVRVISSKFAEVIYETLKQKSKNSAIKRINILKFLNNLCVVNESHLHKESYSYHVNKIKCRYKKYDILEDIRSDLNGLNVDLRGEILKCSDRRNYKDRRKHLENIKKFDEEKINLHFKKPLLLTKKVSCCKTSKVLVQSLFGEEEIRNVDKKVIHDVEYRRKQIKFGYSVTNLQIKDFSEIVFIIFNELKSYGKLEMFECEFIEYTFNNCDKNKVVNFIILNFPFAYEKITIKLCKNILKCQNEQEINNFFTDLGDNKHYKLIQNICLENIELTYKIKSIIYELFCYSYCNENVLRFCNLF